MVHQLSHCFWIGGSPCSGKSSTAQALADRFNLHYYNCDEAFYRHARLITPEDQPAFYRVTHYSSEALWMRPVEDLLSDEIEIYHEEFPLILGDLLALPADQPVIVEGAALLPELAAPLLRSPERGIWMIPAPTFQWEHYARRDWAKDVVSQCSNPNQAFQNWMERDIRFAEQVRLQAERMGLRVLTVDGSAKIEENITRVQAYLGLA